MTTYICSTCNYQTIKKYNYMKHLKTRKHLNNLKINGVIEVLPPISSESPLKSSEILQNSCKHCGKVFTRSDNLKRHLASRCKNKPQENNLVEQIEELKKDKEEMAKQIELLLTKVGNNYTINNNTNIIFQVVSVVGINH